MIRVVVKSVVGMRSEVLKESAIEMEGVYTDIECALNDIKMAYYNGFRCIDVRNFEGE